MTSEKLLELVKQEADNIKVHATQAEKDKLDIDNFSGLFPTTCLYGQLTGNCFSDRATELLNLCTMPFTPDLKRFTPSTSNRSFKDFRQYSPIEYLIFQGCSKKDEQNLIDYIQGKNDTLELNLIHTNYKEQHNPDILQETS